MQRMPSSSASASSSRGLAEPGEHDLVGGDAGQPRALELAAGHHVGAGAELGQRLDHRLVGIRLHGVADERVHVGEGAGEHLVVPRQRRGRIAIERRADARRQRVETDRLGVEHAVAIIEVMHRARAQLSRTSSGLRFSASVGALGPCRSHRLGGGRAVGGACSLGERGRRRIERAFAPATGQCQRQAERADQGEAEKRAVAETMHGRDLSKREAKRRSQLWSFQRAQPFAGPRFSTESTLNTPSVIRGWISARRGRGNDTVKARGRR